MEPDQRACELAVRQVPGVSYVGWSSEPDGGALQVVLVDPTTVGGTLERIRRLLARYLDPSIRVVVRVSGAPKVPLALELASADGPGTHADAVRGERGELLRLTLRAPSDEVAAELVRRAVSNGIPQHRIAPE